MKKILSYRKAMTLIEIIVVIVVISLIIPALLATFTQVNLRSVDSEAIVNSLFYAENLMEEMRSRRFDENTESPWTNPANLGLDTSTTGVDGSTQENSTDHANWDDIDDYHGYSDSPAVNYSRLISVEYADLSGTSWVTTAGVSNYKKITVSVTSVFANIGTVSLEMIVSNY